MVMGMEMDVGWGEKEIRGI